MATDARAFTTTQTLALSGVGKDDPVPWQFYCTGGQNSGAWSTIGVPSCWELKGFGTYNYGTTALDAQSSEQGMYQKTFAVPAAWAGQSVQIVFEGVMTDAAVKVNGVSAGAIHQGAFTQFRYEIGSLLNYGADNLLEVTVSKKSANISINNAERTADYWIFGGIYRPVYLECRPPQAIQQVALNAPASGSLTARVALNAITTADTLTGHIETLAGQPVGAPFSTSLASGATSANLSATLSGVTPWNPEAPALYNLVLELSQGGALIHSVTQRSGFRTAEVRAGDGVYLNGVKIRLKGFSRHTFWPDSGRTSSPALSADVIEGMRGVNVNATRTCSYPPDQHFLDQCDEAGIMVLDELPGWQSPPYDDATSVRMVGEMVGRDVNHPSIILWANGDEGGWNTKGDAAFPVYDPQGRAVIHPGSNFAGNIAQGGLDTTHYPSYNTLTSKLAGANLYFPTEILHGLYDGGAGAGFDDFWKTIRASSKGAGMFIWAWGDEGVVRTDQGGVIDTATNQGPDGIVGPYAQKEPSYDTIRDLWSPVLVPAAPTLNATFTGAVALQNDYFFTNLSAGSFTWEVLDFPALAASGAVGATVASSGTLPGPAVAPQASGTLQIPLPVDWQSHDALRLTARDGNGRFLRLWTWPIQSTATIAARNVPAATGTAATAIETADAVTLIGGGTQVSISKTTGRISGVNVGGAIVSLANGPRLVSGTGTFTQLTFSADGADMVAAAVYSGNLSAITYRMRGDGWLKIDYAFSLTGSQTAIGVTFDYPSAKVTGLRWLGAGPQPVWANRIAGPALSVWQKPANDAIPGQAWTLDPVFRGYHAGLYWATLQTSESAIDVVNTTPDLFLRVLTPSNGSTPLSATFTMPAGDLSLLNAISPMGEKFHTPSAANLGPASGPTTAAGNYAGSFWLHFQDSSPQPQVTSATADSPGRISVVYSRTMTAAAFDPASYLLTPSRAIHAVMAVSANVALLDVQPLSPNVAYTLNIAPVAATNGQTLATPAAFPLAYGGGQAVSLPFDNIAGGTTPDASGNGRTATLTGVSAADGYYAGAANFAGTTASFGSVTLPALPRFTMSAWVQPASKGSSAYPRVLSLGGDAVQFFLDYSGQGSIALNALGHGDWRSAAGILPAFGSWFHVAVSYDSTGASGPAFYLNGAPVVTGTTATSNGTFVTAGAAGIGNRLSDKARAFAGLIDNLQIYDHALSPAEVAALASAPPTKTYAQWAAGYNLGADTLLADTDGDGIANALERLFASNPTQPGAASVRTLLGANGLEFYFPVANDYEGTMPTIETSATLAADSWLPLSSSQITLWRQYPDRLEYRALVPLDGVAGESKFVRLRLNP